MVATILEQCAFAVRAAAEQHEEHLFADVACAGIPEGEPK
jgi:hypothetical protein